MKQKIQVWQQCCVMIILIISFQPIQAERYRLEDKAAELTKFTQTLTLQSVKLGDLLERVDKVEAWRIRLDQKQVELQQENEQMLSDKKRVGLSEISSDEFQQKWNLSGRVLRYERELDEFKQDVVRYNRYLHAYNELAKEMMPVIQKRTPEDVKALLSTIHRLQNELADALSRNDIKAAEQLVLQSGLGTEFGYTN